MTEPGTCGRHDHYEDGAVCPRCEVIDLRRDVADANRDADEAARKLATCQADFHESNKRVRSTVQMQKRINELVAKNSEFAEEVVKAKWENKQLHSIHFSNLHVHVSRNQITKKVEINVAQDNPDGRGGSGFIGTFEDFKKWARSEEHCRMQIASANERAREQESAAIDLRMECDRLRSHAVHAHAHLKQGLEGI